MDSGASHHMTPRYEDLLTLERYNVCGIITADDTCLRVVAKGRFQLLLPSGKILELQNVQWVPELNGALLSVGALNKSKLQVVLGDGAPSSDIAPKGKLHKKIAHIGRHIFYE